MGRRRRRRRRKLQKPMCLTVTDGGISEEKCETEELANTMGKNSTYKVVLFIPPAALHVILM